MEAITWASERAERNATSGRSRQKLITWSGKLAVGIRVIDEQHKQLVGLVNQLADAMYSGKSGEVLSPTLIALENYAVHHFDSEEELMSIHGYRESASHKRGHRLFTETIQRLRKQSESGRLVASTEVLFFLGEWINTHVMKSDRAFCQALRRLGVE